MREIGKPAVNVHFAAGTPEEAARIRKNMESAFQFASLRHGENVKLIFSWCGEPACGELKH